MKSRHKLLLLTILLGLGIFFLLMLVTRGAAPVLLNPKGLIAAQQRDLLILTTLLGVVVVIPVFILTFGIVWKYRASNVAARYLPDWDHSNKLELVWWGLPLLIITVLAVVTWNSSHSLDPHRPLQASREPLTIQVVALDWKWLFLYPEERVASVNYLQFPEDRPVRFVITADAPMNSFWIPQLGGQIYAMPGMTTNLNLIADEVGSYRGVSANLSGEGFAGMDFVARASSETDFNKWIASVRRSAPSLDDAQYAALAIPSKNVQATVYSFEGRSVYDAVVMKYMQQP
jgi:cytochrome o ubiquinol oxidase subunit 2